MGKKCEHCGKIISANADKCCYCCRKVYNAFKKEGKTMTKNELKTGMRVKTKKGELFLVLKGCWTNAYGYQDLFFASFDTGFMPGCNFNDNLTNKVNSVCDIIEVFTAYRDNECCGANTLDVRHLFSIWKREEPQKMTVSEIQEKLGYRIEIVE